MPVKKVRAPQSFEYPKKVEDFLAALHDKPTDDFDEFLQFGDDFDSLLTDSDMWTDLLNRALDTVINGKPASEIQASRLNLLSGNAHVSLSTGVLQIGAQTLDLPEKSDFLANSGIHLMVGILSDEPVRALRYRLPDNADFDIFDSNVALELVDEFMLPPRTRLNIRGDNEVVDFKTTETDCAFIAGSSWVVSQIWSFSLETLRPVGASLSSLDSSILLSMMSEISRTGLCEAEEKVEALFDHPDHNVRWAAVKCLGALGSARTVGLLERALKDPHPHIRNAARATRNAA
jgi:hypothetical protein